MFREPHALTMHHADASIGQTMAMTLEKERIG
jgi:hypothetical protein